jgi:carbonic anhydrase
MKIIYFLMMTMLLSVLVHAQVNDAPISKAEQQSLTPDAVLTMLLEGNERFAANEPRTRNITARIAESASGQYPKAVILSCLDSRVPVEKVFDVSIGDIFIGRNAGNVINTDQLGSMEFATKLAGAKLVFVLGHTECGAVKGAISDAKLGNLTSLLAKIKPAVAETDGFEPDARTANNAAFVNEVAEQNVRNDMAAIRQHSPILAELEASGQIKIVGGMYDVHTGKITMLK